MQTVDEAPGSVRGRSSLPGACLDPASQQLAAVSNATVQYHEKHR